MEHEAERNFFLRTYFKNPFLHCMIEIFFSHQHGRMHLGSHYLIRSLFSDYILFWCRSMGTEAW